MIELASMWVMFIIFGALAITMAALAVLLIRGRL